jgi:hypothetical protein
MIVDKYDNYSPFKNQKTTNVAFSSIITIGNAV